MFIVYLILTLIMLTVLVSVHEFGHFLAAKKCGVEVQEFAVGMGPALFKKQGRETLYSIRAIPMGGYCKMLGESEEDEESLETRERDFRYKNSRQRILILAAGVIFNFLFGLALVFFLMTWLGLSQGANLFQILRATFAQFFAYAGAIFESLRILFTGGAKLTDLAGPIGMVQMVQEVAIYGWMNILGFCAFLSINLGIMNLLPIPALDGGQILIELVEKLVRHKLSDTARGILIGVSFMLLIALMLFVAYNDIVRIATT